MAKSAVKKAKGIGKSKTVSRKKRVTYGIFSAAFGLLLLYFYYPSFILIGIGLIPTFILYISDTSKAKNMARTTFWMNFAGCILVLLQLWKGQNTAAYAFTLMGDWINWLIILTCTMVGWCLHIIMPPFVESYLEISYQVKLKNLYDEKNNLEAIWGEDVTKTSDLITLKEMEETYEDLKAKEEARQNRIKANLGVKSN